MSECVYFGVSGCFSCGVNNALNNSNNSCHIALTRTAVSVVVTVAVTVAFVVVVVVGCEYAFEVLQVLLLLLL